MIYPPEHKVLNVFQVVFIIFIIELGVAVWIFT